MMLILMRFRTTGTLMIRTAIQLLNRIAWVAVRELAHAYILAVTDRLAWSRLHKRINTITDSSARSISALHLM
jgi:hypothetical protein